MENEEKAPTVIEQIEAIRNTDEFKTLVTNRAKEYIGGELKTVYSAFDSVVKDTLGLDKPTDTKSTDWIKQNLSKISEAQKELDVLKGKGTDNEAQNKLWNDKFNKLKGELATKDQELKNVSQKGFENNVSSQLDNFLVGKSFKPTYSNEDVQLLVNAKKAKIISNTKTLDNGKVAVFNASEDKFYLDTLGEPLTPVQVAELEFSAMFHTKTPGGDTPQGEIKATTKGDVIAVDMNKIKSKQDFFNEFKELIAPKGLVSHEEKYLKIQRATMEHYKINALPLS
tara:strand:- start:448 stop:1296 length:849 start_codon:yes stop_codon:yes gene_type:complete